jgi:hypothetical protein
MEELIKISIEEFKLKNNLKFDLFICCSSFEERCITISENLDKDQLENVRICHFENNYEISNINCKRLADIFSSNSFKIIILKKHDPINNYTRFKELLETLNEGCRIAVDITTFTRENLLILLRIILLTKINLDIHFYYTPSSVYSSDVDIQDCWLSKGVKDIRSIFGYPGDFSPIKNFLLVVLSGFEYERAQTLIDNYEPTKILLGKAPSIDSINSSLAELNEINFRKLKQKNPMAEDFLFSCVDIIETKRTILQIMDKYNEEFNIIIAPMNNKLSTLAVGLAAIENPKMQICYASTNQYNINCYSSATDFIYSINIKKQI